MLNPKKSSEDTSLIERQANHLGTALLMPTSQVKRAFYNLRNSGKHGDTVAILAKRFEVSPHLR